MQEKRSFKCRYIAISCKRYVVQLMECSSITSSDSSATQWSILGDEIGSLVFTGLEDSFGFRDHSTEMLAYYRVIQSRAHSCIKNHLISRSFRIACIKRVKKCSIVSKSKSRFDIEIEGAHG